MRQWPVADPERSADSERHIIGSLASFPSPFQFHQPETHLAFPPPELPSERPCLVNDVPLESASSAVEVSVILCRFVKFMIRRETQNPPNHALQRTRLLRFGLGHKVQVCSASGEPGR